MLRLTQGFLFLYGIGYGDQYLQNPKGCNNRLNEKSANRNNANRLFDSQNNNRGGYNVGETGQAGQAFANNNGNGALGEGTFAGMYDVSAESNQQYDLIYQEGSQLPLTWTSQHGCGNAMNNCNMVIQFGCDNVNKDTDFEDLPAKAGKGLGIRMQLHNGKNTGTPAETNNFSQVGDTAGTNDDNGRGRHESEEFYTFCRRRQRDEGLFTADQKLKGNTQKYTRQNPNGNRSGLECPEERDYMSWPHPTPWRDLFWIGHDVEYCKEHIAPFSQNVHPKGSCTGGGANVLPTNAQGAQVTEEACTEAGGTWVTTSWGPTTDAAKAAFANTFCQDSKWSQVNHLGNVDGTTLGGQMNNIMWTIPSFAELTDANGWKCHAYPADTDNGVTTPYVRGVIRTRYNISTGDYDPYQTFSDQNNDPKNGVISPITENPTVDVGAWMQGLRLAINTAQTGRTFQDRSHVFKIIQKPPQAAAAQRTAPMLNVNVRGKRGNIVQTFPAMEYDFTTNDFTMSTAGTCAHFQWTGSNTHNNGNPAGDGQAGDAGEGAGGTDRSNIMEMKSLRKNFPKAYDKDKADGIVGFFDTVNCKYPLDNTGTWIDKDFVKAIFATAGYYYSDGSTTLQSVDSDQVNNLLNNVSASFKQGLVCCTDANSQPGTYYFQSTRNNNFSNRSQKMRIQIVGGAAEFKLYPATFTS